MGVPAGRLSIELVAEIARLQQDLDKAKKAVNAASKDIAKSARHANDNLAGMGRVSNDNFGRMASGSKLASHHVSNLAFQLQDVVVGLSSGQKPMTVFMQQGSHIGQIMMQAGIGVGGLTKALLGMASASVIAVATNPALLAMAATLGVIAAGVALVTDEINKTSDVTVTWQDVLLGAFDVIKANLETQVTAAFQSMGLDVKETWDFIVKATKIAINLIIGMNMLVPKVIAATYNKIGPAIADGFYSAANLAIGALNWLVQASATPLNLLIRAINAAFGKEIPEIVLGGVQELQNPYAGAMAALGGAAAKAVVGSFTTDYTGGIASELSSAAQNRAKVREAAEKHGSDVGKRVGKSAGASAGKTLKDVIDKNLKGFMEMTAAIDDQIRSVQAANNTIGMYGKSLYQFSALQELINDAEKRGIQLTNEQKTALAQKALALGEVKAQGDVLRFMEDFRVNTEASTRALETERGEIGLTGAALYAYRFEQEVLNKAIAAHVNLTPEQIAAIKAAGKAYGDNRAALDEQANAAQRANDELRDMISLLQGIGGLGGAIGGALGVLQGFQTGDFSDARGKVGTALKMITKIEGGDEFLKGMGTKFDSFLGKFGTSIEGLGEVFKGLGMGAAIGNASDGIMKALGIKSSNTGAQIGGALGGLTGNPFIALGASILGGIVGGMLKKTKWARADISSATGDANYRSNSGKYEGAVNEAASSVVKGLNDIAEQLGGVAGEFASIAVGVRDGKWRVNTTGTSLKTSKGAKDFGEDGAAAIAYAIQQAIQKGAIDGINASVMNLLQASGDFETQLGKAVQLQNIFAEVASAADPMGFELQQLAKKFVSINALLTEANATQAEIDQVAAYQAQQEAAIRQRYAEEAAAKRAQMLDKESELLALQGKATLSLAKAREAEISQMDAATAAIQKQIYAEEDAATRRGLMIQLMEAQGNALAAEALNRAEVMRVTLDENKALQERIFLTTDLRNAYDRESEALKTTAEEMKNLGDTLRDFRKEIYASDNSVLSTTQAMVKLMTTGALAATGDKTALGDLSTVGRDYLDAAKASAGSLLDYQRAQALVANYTDQAIGYTDTAASEAEQQLALMKSQAESLISIDENTQSFEDTLAKLVAHNQATAAPAPAPTTNSGQQGQNSNGDMSAGFDGMRRMFEQMLRKFNQMAPDGPMQVEVIAP